jgi:shikimate dehydrogenase
MIRGTTELIAHLGYPTQGFKAPMIYNPWFESQGIDAVVVPMGSRAEDFPRFVREVFRLSNIRGALITMPHKVTMVGLLEEASTAVQVAGSCNAVRRDERGRLIGDMFDGEGFVRGLRRKGVTLDGASVLIVGCGGVGSAIAASFAGTGIARLALHDVHAPSAVGLSQRLRRHFPQVEIHTGSNDPHGFDVLVNATPLGMAAGDPLPVDMERVAPSTFVGEVVMKNELTPFLRAAQARGCRIQVGTDMLFEQIPAYLEFFGFGTTTPEALRAVADVSV